MGTDYNSEQEELLRDDEYMPEGKKPTPLEKRVDELLANLTPEQLQAYKDQGLTIEEIRAQLIEMASATTKEM
jgi:hypothetical protein